jgi:hypothetical protein
MKHFNHHPPRLRTGSSDKLLHFICLAKTAQGFSQPFARLPRRRTTRATKAENDFAVNFGLHFWISPQAT